MRPDTDPTIRPQPSLNPLLAAAALFLVGAALTLALFKMTGDADRMLLQLKLNEEAAHRTADLERAFKFSLQVVESLRRLYQSSNEVTGREFRRFSEPVLADHSYIQALEWAPRVAQAERSTFEAVARAEGLADFRVTERAQDGRIVTADRRAEYFPLRHIVPLSGNEPALGYDIATQRGRTAILDVARDSGETQISNVFRPVQSVKGQLAFAILSPVYRNGMPRDTIAARRVALAGYVIGLIRTGDLLEAALEHAAPVGLDMEVRDETVPDAPVLIDVHASRLRSTEADAFGIVPGLERRETLEHSGRRWVLRFVATPAFVRINGSHRATYVLAGGLALFLLLSGYLFEVMRRRARVARLADDLARSNVELQTVSERLSNLIAAAPMGIVAVDRDERVTEWNPAAEHMFGWCRDEVLGLPPPPMNRDDPSGYQALKKGKTIAGVETERRRKDGTLLPVRIAGAPMRDLTGRMTGLMGIFEDLTEIQHAREQARRRDAMLEALQVAASYLLGGARWSLVTQEVLRALGEAAEVDRAMICANHRAPDGTLLAAVQSAWTREGGVSVDMPEVQTVPYPRDGRWRETLARGEVLQGNVEDFPEEERAILAKRGVVSVLLAPISVDGEWWGFIGFDTCRARREWDAEETRLLGIAAGGIASAIRRARLQQRLRQSALVFEHTVDGIVITDAEARTLDVNDAFTEITGYSREEAVGRNPNLIRSDRHDLDFYRAMWQVLLREGLWRGEIWNRRKNGEVFPARLTIRAVTSSAGKPTHYVGVLTDLTAIRETQDRLEYLAHYDPLTDLPNKRLFDLQLEQAIKRAARARARVVLLFINIDRLKDVNNSLGHLAGDALLQQFAARLVASLRKEDQVARHGGDGFLVLLEHLHDSQAAEIAAEKLLNALAQPFRIGDQELFISASIGICLFPDDGNDPEALLRGVNAALSRAKELGRGRYQFYTDDLTGRARERVALGAQLRRATEEHQLQVYFQPQVDLGTDRVVGAEALLRWKHPELGMVSPAKFIPLAEELGLIVPIGEWVLRTACRTARAWCEGGFGFRRVSVNVAGPQMTSKFVGTVRDALAESGLPPACLELEVTESFIMGHAEEAIGLLHELKALGVALAIDDFGTGYSSLSYLKHLPIDKLKIDQSFVRGIPKPDDAAIARAIISLAKSLQLRVIAEGVETPVQRDFLKAEACDEGQGYLYSKPIPGEDFEKLLNDGI